MIGRQKLPTENTEEDEEEMTTGVTVDTDDGQGNDNGNDNEDENNFGTVMTIQVPSTATAGSILEVVDPSNNECRIVVVPDGIEAGQYFQIYRDSWKVCSDYSQENAFASRDSTTCCCIYGDSISASFLTSSKTRIPTDAFDCIRGMGALQVSLGHFFTFYADFENAATPEFGGGNAVLMFFVMSGFLMTIGYAGAS